MTPFRIAASPRPAAVSARIGAASGCGPRSAGRAMSPPDAPSRLLREAAFALAALAVWMLALLTPAHQASRLAAEMRLAGAAQIAAWTLCLPGGALDDEGGALKSLCPAQAAAHALDAPPAATGLRSMIPRRLGGALRRSARPVLRRARRGRKQARAPPAARESSPPAFPFIDRETS